MIRAASPISYLDAKDPPFLLLHGADDKVVPVAQSRQLEAALKAAGMPVSASYYPGTDHSFMGATPDDTRRISLKALPALLLITATPVIAEPVAVDGRASAARRNAAR